MIQHLCFHIQMIELLSFKWTNFHFSFNSFQRVSPKTRKLTLKKRGKKTRLKTCFNSKQEKLVFFKLKKYGKKYEKYCRILSSILHIQVQRAPEFHNDFGQKNLFLFYKNNFMRFNHCKFIHHKSHLTPFLSYLPCIACREYFNIIFNIKNCALYSIKYSTYYVI